MPPFSQRTLYLSLSVFLLIVLTTLTLTPPTHLKILPITSPFTRKHDQSDPLRPQPPQQKEEPPQSEPPSPPPAQPQQHQHQQDQQPTWLLATISAYPSQRRRNIIRATWQSLYPNPAFDTRFVLAQPSALWQPLIQHENDTYGDLIVLEGLEESAEVANSIKSVEFLKHIVDKAASEGVERPWEFVSKIDDDSFLSAERFYQEFIIPHLSPPPSTPPPSSPGHQPSAVATTPEQDDHGNNDRVSNGTLIARRLIRPYRPFSTPGGQFYTLSWDLVRLVVDTYTKEINNPDTTTTTTTTTSSSFTNTTATPPDILPPLAELAEDVLIGRLLYDAKASFEFVDLDDATAFDISDDGSGTLGRLGKDKVDLGPMDGRALNPHKMKDDDMYLTVAGLFDKDGFVGGG